jgi:hypothetical protein
MTKQIAGIAVALCAVSAIAANQGAKREARWVGQVVALLPSAAVPSGLYRTTEKPDAQYRAGHLREYLGREGTVEAIDSESKTATVRLSNGESVVAHWNNIGFKAELTVAQSFVGRVWWTRGGRYLSALSTDFSQPEDTWRANISVKPATKVTVVAARWAGRYAPVGLVLRMDDGREGIFTLLDHVVSFEPDFNSRAEKRWTPDDHFYSTDPRKTFSSWGGAIWQAVESERVVVGMTADMLSATCRYLFEDGKTYEPGQVFVRMQCGTTTSPRRFLMQNGKVVRLID